jgi:hypothetical protein
MLSQNVAYIDAYTMWVLFQDFFVNGDFGDTNTRNIENLSPRQRDTKNCDALC